MSAGILIAWCGGDPSKMNNSFDEYIANFLVMTNTKKNLLWPKKAFVSKETNFSENN